MGAAVDVPVSDGCGGLSRWRADSALVSQWLEEAAGALRKSEFEPTTERKSAKRLAEYNSYSRRQRAEGQKQKRVSGLWTIANG